jgi:hypothetical protein
MMGSSDATRTWLGPFNPLAERVNEMRQTNGAAFTSDILGTRRSSARSG